MRRTLITVCFAALVLLGGLLGTARATDVGYGRKFGLGIELGDTSGVTAKYWVGPTNSVAAGLGFWGYGFNDCWHDGAGTHCNGWGYSGGTFHVDYLWQSNIVRGTAQLDWHIGAGGRTGWFNGCSGTCFDLAARLPIGLDLMFANPSFLEVFLEIAPALVVVPGLWVEFQPELGVRYYF
jgi:hypothetical protein